MTDNGNQMARCWFERGITEPKGGARFMIPIRNRGARDPFGSGHQSECPRRRRSAGAGMRPVSAVRA